HQAGIHANQVQFFDACICLNFGKRLVQFIQEDRILLEGADDGRAAAVGGGGRRVAPAAGPAHAVVGHNQHVAVGGVVPDSPGHKVYQGVSVRHVHFAQVHQQL